MFIPDKLRRLLLVAALGLGVLSGAPMRPDEIANLQRLLNQTRIERVLHDEKDGDPPVAPTSPD